MKNKVKLKYFTFILVLCIFLVSIYKLYNFFILDTKETQFIRDTYNVTKPKVNIIINKDLTIKYLKEDFNNYKDYSLSIENFETLENLSFTGINGKATLSKNNYDGDFSLSINLSEGKGEKFIKKIFIKPLDISRWTDFGFVTSWINIQNSEGIDGIKLFLGDDKGNYREFNELINLQFNVPNILNKDDIYPDISYPETKSSIDEWTDFRLQKGWNFLPWQSRDNYFTDYGKVDLKNIKWSKIVFKINDKFKSQNILIDDIRIQDGLQKERNATNSMWYPPHGRPQYGVYDIGKYGSSYGLKLLNVRQTQYPSNGDNGIILTKYLTPTNFALKVEFTLKDFINNNITNTWFRVMYDFEPDLDPGHDWLGVFISKEWDKFGLISVKPIERFYMQEQEPLNENIALSSTNIKAKEDARYELNLTVKRQENHATLYEIKNNKKIKIDELTYIFNRQRYIEKRYPFGLEITGNIKAIIHNIEIIELGKYTEKQKGLK